MVLVQQFDADLLLTLGALAASTTITVNSSIDASRLQGFRVVKSELKVTMTGKTTAEGPITFGVAANFESAAEINAALEADPQGRASDDSRGKGTFLMILDSIGLVPTVFPASDEGVGKSYTISYGKNGWSIPEGRNLQFWARNQGANLSSGTLLIFVATHFGVWLND